MNAAINMVKGIVIRESLRNGELPRELSPFVADRYQYFLGGMLEVEIIVLRVDEQMVPNAACLLAETLIPQGYYAHFVQFLLAKTLAPQGYCDYFVFPDRLWVVFPNSVVIAPYGDTEALQRCRTLGRRYGIPEDQMPFEAMFEVDHPNAH